MTAIGNHLKMQLPRELRERAKAFYGDVLGCPSLDSPLPELDLYAFDGGFVLGIFFGAADEALTADDHLRGTWLELKVADPEAVKRRLLAFGVSEVDYVDRSRFYFQAPGGQVFRLAALDGGI
jgi:hypothetical protein